MAQKVAKHETGNVIAPHCGVVIAVRVPTGAAALLDLSLVLLHSLNSAAARVGTPHPQGAAVISLLLDAVQAHVDHGQAVCSCNHP